MPGLACEDGVKWTLTLGFHPGLLKVQGNYADAEPPYRRALEIYETQ